MAAPTPADMLLRTLRNIKESQELHRDLEVEHGDADDALLRYIRATTPEAVYSQILGAWEEIDKWYA